MRIRERIRMGLNYLITDRLLENDVNYAYFLCKFLTEFDKGHFDHFYVFGGICASLGKVEEACQSLGEAIRICKGDKNWNSKKTSSDPSIGQIIEQIEKEMLRLGCDSLAGKTMMPKQ